MQRIAYICMIYAIHMHGMERQSVRFKLVTSKEVSLLLFDNTSFNIGLQFHGAIFQLVPEVGESF